MPSSSLRLLGCGVRVHSSVEAAEEIFLMRDYWRAGEELVVGILKAIQRGGEANTRVFEAGIAVSDTWPFGRSLFCMNAFCWLIRIIRPH